MQLSPGCPVAFRSFVDNDGDRIAGNAQFLKHPCHSFNGLFLILLAHASPDCDLDNRQFQPLQVNNISVRLLRPIPRTKRPKTRNRNTILEKKLCHTASFFCSQTRAAVGKHLSLPHLKNREESADGSKVNGSTK
jgi:hypothetical protein